jgi:hypothetical protein
MNIITQGLGGKALLTQGYGGGGTVLMHYITKLFIVPFRKLSFKL